MRMFVESFGCVSLAGNKMIQVLDIAGTRLGALKCKTYARFAHREAALAIALETYDSNLSKKDVRLTCVGKLLSKNHYGWIIVITRRTTRTRA